MFKSLNHRAVFRRETLRAKRSRTVIPFLLLGLAAGGCMVTSSKYEIKNKEADVLRDALASTSKEKTILEARSESMKKQLSDVKSANETLSAQVRAQEEELRRLNDELGVARKSYEGTRITREQFITELLEKEKATGKRIQDLNAKVQRCELSLENLRKEAGVRQAELVDLRSRIENPADNEAMKRERDILVGRVERLTEERRQEEKRRDDRFTALAESLRNLSAEIALTPLGPTLRVFIPDKVLFVKGKSSLSDTGKKAVASVGKTASEFSTSSVLLSAEGKKLAEEIRNSLVNQGKVSRERILLKMSKGEKGAELLLLIP